jgi:hypothetical protein
VEDDLGVLGVVLVPGVVEGLPGARHRHRRDQAKAEALNLEEVSEGAVIVARGLEGDATAIVTAGEQDGKLGEIFEVIGNPEVSTMPVRKFEQRDVVSLGDIHGYPQNRRSVRNRSGHG